MLFHFNSCFAYYGVTTYHRYLAFILIILLLTKFYCNKKKKKVSIYFFFFLGRSWFVLLLLPAVGHKGVKCDVTLSAHHFVAVVLLGENSQRRFDDASSQPQHQMKSRLLLDVVIRQGPAVFQLIPEDQSLLVGWDLS